MAQETVDLRCPHCNECQDSIMELVNIGNFIYDEGYRQCSECKKVFLWRKNTVTTFNSWKIKEEHI